MELEAAKFLNTLMQKALAAVKPDQLIRAHLADLHNQPQTVVGFGKAAAHMALAVEQELGKAAQGLVVVPYGYEASCKWIKVMSARHPVPDTAGVLATTKIIKTLNHSDGPILALVSGGGSSVLCAPADFITLEEKQTIISQLLAKGTPITQLNSVRGALSKVKVGGLAQIIGNRRVRVLVLSDVAGDDPHVVASGPFFSQTPNGAQCLTILDKAKITISNHIRQNLHRLDGQAVHQSNMDTKIIGCGATALSAAENWAISQGVRVHNLSDTHEASAEELAKTHLEQINQHRSQHIQLFLSGGEATVEVVGDGQGGPNRHFLLHLAAILPVDQNIAALAIDTDGRDGSDAEAGAWFTNEMLGVDGLSLQEALINCNSGPFFKNLGTSIHLGATGTNVNDFRAILTWPKAAPKL